MPQNGEINNKFAVYRSMCCGSEIIIREKATFPDCPNHPKLMTIWNEIANDKDVIVPDKSKASPAA